MAFNLKKVIRALLFSSSQPLAIKDIQTAFARFHDSEEAQEQEAAEALAEGASYSDSAGAALAADPAVASAVAMLSGSSEPSAAPAEEEQGYFDSQNEYERELYREVPSLVTSTQIREVMDAIAADLREADEGLLLIEGNAGYRLVTHPRFARWVRLLRGEPAPARLSRSALETLAIVAYRQPVTRSEIETIRGVSADAGLNKLIERELVYVVGRAELPGRPIQYGTTEQFLEFVGLRSIDELPASDVLSNRQIDEWLQASAEAAATPASDATMGLPLEEGEAGAENSPNLEPVDLEPASLSSEASTAATATIDEPPELAAEPAENSPAAPEAPLTTTTAETEEDSD